jgi:hypothetical protein
VVCGRDPGKTKKPRLVSRLESFDEAVDCAVANNRLKRLREHQKQGGFGSGPEFALNIRIKAIFLMRSQALSRDESVLPPRGERDGETGKQ